MLLREHDVSDTETHPLPPFAPSGAKLLMLGSFPPPHRRWTMDFYYPNRQNDMWRIFGLVFFGDKDYFIENKNFRETAIRDFLMQTGIAVADAAHTVRRLQGNAADKFLEVVEPLNVAALLARLPECRTIAFTGDKAADTLLPQLGAKPAIGIPANGACAGRALRLYRLPSSSRAYPLPLADKAAAYRQVFAQAGVFVPPA
nr:uracil-DNA glycosylase family protein [Conchiformibius kuhniae]